MSPPLLLTGFDAFGGARINPSSVVALALQGQDIGGHRVEAMVLPTVYGEADRLLLQAVRKHRPALVCCLGQAGGRASVSLERVAINLADADLEDNAGRRCHDEKVMQGGPDAYFCRLSLKPLLAALKKAGIPAEISLSAGSFVCNYLYYRTLHALEKEQTRMLFVHLPWLPEQGEPSMPLHVMELAVRCLLEEAVATGSGPSPG